MSANEHSRSIGVAIIGAGLRGVWDLGWLMAQGVEELGLEIVSLCEPFAPRAEQAKAFLEQRYAEAGRPLRIDTHAEIDACLADERVELVMVTTPSHCHREPVEKTLAAGKTVYLDKPLAHSTEDCDAILQLEADHGRPIMLGFTRRYESAWRRTWQLVREGTIGDVHMLLLRAVIPYHVYFHGWHRERRFSGDALNDKSSHHFDAMTWFAGAAPTRVSAFGGRRVFLSDSNAPQRCSACDRTCPYRFGERRAPDSPWTDWEASWLGEDVLTQRDLCVFQPGADILDHAVVNVQFANGVVGQLFYSIFGFDTEDQETFEIVGDRGRIRLIRHTGELEIVADHGGRRETIQAADENHSSFHFGADKRLLRELRSFADGAAPTVTCADGHLASATVFAALESIGREGASVKVR